MSGGDLAFIGLISDGNEGAGVFLNRASGQTLTLRPGQAFLGWELKKLGQGQAKLVLASGEEILLNLLSARERVVLGGGRVNR